MSVILGSAIGSTITGIGLRVIFNQMRRDPVDVERVMRLELADAARRVRRELDSTVVEFGYHRRSAQQAAVRSWLRNNRDCGIPAAVKSRVSVKMLVNGQAPAGDGPAPPSMETPVSFAPVQRGDAVAFASSAARTTPSHLRAAVLSRVAGSRVVARTEREAITDRADKGRDVRCIYFRNGGNGVG